jgi:hypothetical protein
MEELMRELDPTLELLRALRDVGTTDPPLDRIKDTIDRALERETRRRHRGWRVRGEVVFIGLSAAVAVAVAFAAVIVLHHRQGSPEVTSRPSTIAPPRVFRPSRTARRALERELESFQARSYCVSRTRYANRAQQILTRQGWTGWRVIVEAGGPRGALGTGACARIPVLDRGIPSLSSLLNIHSHQVILTQGEPPSVDRAVGFIFPSLSTTTGRRCFTTPALKALVRTAMRTRAATARLTPAFAQTQEPTGLQFDAARQRRYSQGCAVLITMGMPAGSLRQLDVWITQKNAPPLPRGLGEPTPASYH